MKRKLGKLVLSRESIRELTDRELEDVVGKGTPLTVRPRTICNCNTISKPNTCICLITDSPTCGQCC